MAQKGEGLSHGKGLRRRNVARSSKKTNGCIRYELGEDVPDSGQEHLAYSDNGFLVSSAGLDPAVAFREFRMLLGVDESIGYLNQKRFEKRTCTGNARGFDFSATLVISWTAASP